MKYSVIIPHRNTPALLMRCLESIPVRPDVQVIVVDDCSDGADEFLTAYPQLSRQYLEFYSTTQGGSVGRARNIGLEHARGEWIAFIDADDYVEEGFFDNELTAGIDLYVANWRLFGGGEAPDEHVKPQVVRGDGLAEFWASNGQLDLFHTVWAKFYRRDIIEQYGLRFDPQTRYGEDTLFDIDYYAHCQSIEVLADSCYMYYRPAAWGTKYRMPLAEMLRYMDRLWSRYKQLPVPIVPLLRSVLKYDYENIIDCDRRSVRLRFLLHPSVYCLHQCISSRTGLAFALSYVRGLLINAF